MRSSFRRTAVVLVPVSMVLLIASCEADPVGDTSGCKCVISETNARREIECGKSFCRGVLGGADTLVHCKGMNDIEDLGPCPGPDAPPDPPPKDSGPDAIADAGNDAAEAGPTACTLVKCLHNADCADAGGVEAVCLESGDAFKTKFCYVADTIQKTCASKSGTTPLAYKCQGDLNTRAAACVPNACTTEDQKPAALQDQTCL